jgi:hypothetical protein
MSLPVEDDRALLTVTAALLEQGHHVNRLSLPLTVVALAASLLAALATASIFFLLAITAAVAAGVAQAYMALRVAFDMRLLRRLAGEEPQAPLDVASFDAACRILGLMPPHKLGRPLAERARGSIRLLRLQGVACAVQVVALVAAGWLLASGM